jgi:hypothetical protein
MNHPSRGLVARFARRSNFQLPGAACQVSDTDAPEPLSVPSFALTLPLPVILMLILLAGGVIDCSIATSICIETIEKQADVK